jgi:hypothetical protein
MEEDVKILRFNANVYNESLFTREQQQPVPLFVKDTTKEPEMN